MLARQAIRMSQCETELSTSAVHLMVALLRQQCAVLELGVLNPFTKLTSMLLWLFEH